MNKITYQDISVIIEKFTVFLSELKESTRNLYLDIVKEYLLNEVRNQVDKSDYESIFLKERIIDFQLNYRKGQVIRAALNNLKDYFIKDGKLEKRFDFEFEFIGKKEKVNKSVISLTDIQSIILGDDGEYRNLEEKIATQCMSAICYFCVFEQRHIMKLKCTDILVDEHRIRNLRTDDNKKEPLAKWIYLGDDVRKFIVEYINFFNINMTSDERFFQTKTGEDFGNQHQNYLLSNYKLKGNGFLNIGAQHLNYSRIYHYLVATKGKGVSDILPMVGFSNEQLKNAMKDYTSDYGIVYNPNSIVTLLDFEDITHDYEATVENYENNVNEIAEEDAVESSDEWINVCNTYSEENDINMDDVLLYDSMNSNNQKTKDVELSRLVRSTYIAESLKLKYDNCCQLCGIRLMKTRTEAYSEAHHIRPYNKTHKGDDTIGNMIVLCPNCHSQFDNLYYAIHPNTKLVHCINTDDKFHLAKLTILPEHYLEEKYLNYTWTLFKK